MTSRERVLAAAKRKPADRAPARFNCGADEVAKRAARELEIPFTAGGPAELTAGWFDRLHRRLAIDMRIVDTAVTGGDYSGDSLCLASAETAADVDRLWPRKWRVENRTLEPTRKQVAAWDAGGLVPAVQARIGTVFTLFVRMRGETRAFMDLADANAVILRAMDRNEEFCAAMIDKAFDTLGDRLDIVYLAEELGMQTGLMYSPETIRRHFFPRFRRLFDKVHTRGGLVFFHTCGAIAPLIEELIDLGVDILNPIQPRLPGMDPEDLARRFGGRVCFCGGIDMQHLLPQGTPDEVREEVMRYIACLGPGYILDAANILHPDIPTANIVAMYDAPRDRQSSTTGL